MALRYLIVKTSRRIYVTIFAMAVAIMFVTTMFILADSFRESNIGLLQRFKSNYYCISTNPDLYESRVPEGKFNGSSCILVKITVEKDNETYITYFLGINDTLGILKYNGEGIWIGSESPILPGEMTIYGPDSNISVYVNRVYRTSFFPNYWLIGNLSTARMLRGDMENEVNFVITEYPIYENGYRCSSMTSIIDFFRASVEEIERDVALTIIIALVISILLMNSVMAMDMKDNSRTIAILRAIGCTRYKIFMVYFARAVYIAITASLFGLSLGIILSYSLVSIIPRFGVESLFNIVVYPYVAIYAILLGFLGAVIGGIPPILGTLKIGIVREMGVEM